MFLIPKDSWQVRGLTRKGRGVFAKKEILKGTIIGDYTGQLVELKDVDYEKEKKNMYLMYYDDLHGIYPDLSKPGVYLLNHSCSPNAWITPYKNHTLVFALKNIQKGKEITISYLLPPNTNCVNCPHTCFCKSINCTGTMHLSVANYKKWQKFQIENWIETDQTSKSKHLKSLKTYPKRMSGNYLTKLSKTGLV